eukprot:3526004-Rhodomonas_salina.1
MRIARVSVRSRRSAPASHTRQTIAKANGNIAAINALHAAIYRSNSTLPFIAATDPSPAPTHQSMAATRKHREIKSKRPQSWYEAHCKGGAMHLISPSTCAGLLERTTRL